jgi:hypothetical protein
MKSFYNAASPIAAAATILLLNSQPALAATA